MYFTLLGAVRVQRDGEIRLQAGGGIVHNSEPAGEYAECLARLGAGARVLGVTVDGAAA